MASAAPALLLKTEEEGQISSVVLVLSRILLADIGFSLIGQIFFFFSPTSRYRETGGIELFKNP